MNEKKYRGTYHEYTDSTDVGADKTLMTAESLKVVNKGKELWQRGNETGDQALMDQGHAMAEAERAKYGYSGGANGGAYNPFELDQGSAKGSSASSASSYTTSPTWRAPYEQQQRSAVRKIESQEPFSYAPETDPTYQQYRDTYTRMGEKARDDTIGVLRSRGGGQVSSYAAIAAQQAEEAYMQELADKVPELRQLAYQMWLDEGDRARSDLRMYDALNSSDAARWGATVLTPYLQDRSYAFDREQYQDSRADTEWEQNFKEQVRQDGLDKEEKDRTERQDNTNYDRQLQKAGLLVNTIGDYSGYAELFGLDAAKVEAMVAEYAKDKALTEAQAARELADWYAQYGDLNKLQELGVNTSYLEQQRDGMQASGGATPPSVPKTPVEKDLGGLSYSDLLSRISHINPGVTAAQMNALYNEIDRALDAGSITQAQYTELGKRLGYK